MCAALATSSLLVAFAATALPATARAAPATPAFLKAWEDADRLLAQSDLLGATRSLGPILSIGLTLDDGAQRLWFDDTAARVLALTGRDEQAQAFLGDGRRLRGQALARLRGLLDAESATASPEWDERLRPPGSRPDLIPDENTLAERFMALRYGSPTDVRSLGESPVLCGIITGGVSHLGGSIGSYLAVAGFFGYRSARELRRDYFAPPPFPRLKPVSGGALMVPSYFAGRVVGQLEQRSTPTCNIRAQRRSGGPTGVQSGTGKYVATIPSTSVIVSRRRVQRGSLISVQAFATRGHKLVATWRPVSRTGKRLVGRRPVRARYSVRNNIAQVRAPSRKGRYDLQLGIRAAKDFATGVSGVGVGVSKTQTTGNSQGGNRGARGGR